MIFIGMTAFLILADIIAKSYVERRVSKEEERAVGKKIVIRKIHNSGACMNLLEEYPRTVRNLSVGFTVFITIYQWLTVFRNENAWKKNGVSLITAGAWSNTLDRCLRGYVVDFIGVRAKNEKLRNITFNLGDVFIFAGSTILWILSVISPYGRKNTRKQKQNRRQKNDTGHFTTSV